MSPAYDLASTLRKFAVDIKEHARMMPDLQAMLDGTYQAHARIDLFLEPQWAEQLKIAVHNISKTGKRPYADLIETAADTVVRIAAQEKKNEQQPTPGR